MYPRISNLVTIQKVTITCGKYGPLSLELIS